MQLDMEKKRKLITLDRLSGKEGRSSTKETECKMFAFLPDVDLDIESLCARKSRKIRGKAITVAKSRYGRTGTAAGQSTGRV